MRICVMVLFLMCGYAFASEQLYQRAYDAYLNENYQEAVRLFHEYIDANRDPRAFYYLGLSYVSLKDYANAKKYLLFAGQHDPNFTTFNKNDYFETLTEIHDRLLEEKLLHQNDVLPENTGIVVFCVLVGWVLLRIFFKRAKKPPRINPQLAQLLQLLNDEFAHIKTDILSKSQALHHPDSPKALIELEERCMILNDRFEHYKSYPHTLDHKFFREEIECTRALIQDYLHKEHHTSPHTKGHP